MALETTMSHDGEPAVRGVQPGISAAWERLHPLVGDWEMTSYVDGALLIGGRTTYEWIENGAFLVQHLDGALAMTSPELAHENSATPLTSIIGLNDATDDFTMLYSDSRGVSRVYRFDIEGSVWRIWGQARGFVQRFHAVISDDWQTIEGYWERSTDGNEWVKDFDVRFVRVNR